jgi:hypothetical protein
VSKADLLEKLKIILVDVIAFFAFADLAIFALGFLFQINRKFTLASQFYKYGRIFTLAMMSVSGLLVIIIGYYLLGLLFLLLICGPVFMKISFYCPVAAIAFQPRYYGLILPSSGFFEKLRLVQIVALSS